MSNFDSVAALSDSGPEPLATLLAAGEPPGPLWSPEETAAIFRHQMAAPLVVDLGSAAPAAAQRLEALTSAPDAPFRSFADLLRHPTPAVDLLGLVKDFAKTNADHPESGLPREVATVLYYACIAAALVRLGTRISKLPEADLARGLRWAADQPFVDDESRQLLAGAAATLEPAGARAAPRI
jgi:hypothetical protein